MKSSSISRVLPWLVLGSGLVTLPVACGGDDGSDGIGGGTGAGGGSAASSGTGGTIIDGGTGATSSMAGGNGLGGDCGGTEVEADPKKVNVLLVVDKSGSMENGAPGFDGSKWDATASALGDAITAVQDSISFGLKLFPDAATDEEQCKMANGLTVDIAAGATAVPDIESELSGVMPKGQTPTADALAAALDYFTEGAGAALEGDNYVLLATDGGPNCNSNLDSCVCSGDPSPGSGQCQAEAATCTTNLDRIGTADTCDPDDGWGSCCTVGQEDKCLDSAATEAQVSDLAAAGVKTFVVGMPGTEAYTDVLNALAVAGDVPAPDADDTGFSFYRVTDAESLSDTLESITKNLVRTCTVQLEENPANEGRVNVFLDGDVIPYNEDGDDGWNYDRSTDPLSIQLNGPTCTRVEEEGVAGISVEFGCETVRLR